jgi:GNAT superfamily N-acetyltransferase
MQSIRFPFLASILSDLRHEHVSVVFNGFELLANEAFLRDLRSTLDDPSWYPYNSFLRRYVTGFAAFQFHWTFFAQPTSPWIFLNESKPIPAVEHLLRYSLRRAILLRYQRLGVRAHFFNHVIRNARSRRVADKLLQRLARK